MNSYGDVVTLVRAPLSTGYGGQQVRNWASATRVPDVPASVQPIVTTEDSSDRQVVSTSKRLFIAGGLVTEVDRVEWGGLTYDVTGVENHYRQGALDHSEATLVVHEEAAT